MSKIEQKCTAITPKLWINALKIVIAVAEGKYEPDCYYCDPMRNNPKIEEFLVNDTIYTPRGLQSSLARKEEVCAFLTKTTLDRMCNIFSALGKAVRSERPLYTKDRRTFGLNKQFTTSYEGEMRDALLSFGDYLVAEQEDIIKLDEKNEWDNCANQDLSRSLRQLKETYVDFGKKYDPKKYGLHGWKEHLAGRLADAQKTRQRFLDDDVQVVEDEIRKGYRCVGILIYDGIEPSISHLIENYTRKVK